MSKKFLSWTLILAFATCHSPSFIRADGEQETTPTIEQIQTQADEPAPIESSPVEEDSEDDANPVGTPVSPSNPSSTSKTANRQFWTNILIAGVAVVVAVVSILVVSNNNGKK